MTRLRKRLDVVTAPRRYWWDREHVWRGERDEEDRTGIEFVPNSLAQWIAQNSVAPELAFSSAFGKGKTRSACESADEDCLTIPRNRVVLARRNTAHLWGTTLKVLLEEVIHPSRRALWRPHQPGGATLHYPNGSELICVGMDNPGRARSGAYGSWYVDQAEELNEEEALEPGGRLRLNREGVRHRVAFYFNPDSPAHWAFRRYRFDRMRPGRRNRLYSSAPIKLPSGKVVPAGTLWAEGIVSGATDNLANLPLSYQIRLAGYSGRYKQRYVDGLWVAFEGQIFDNFDEDVHVRERKPDDWWRRWGGNPPPSWPRYRATDFGFALDHPFVTLWVAKEPGTAPPRYHVYREWHRVRVSPTRHARMIGKLERDEARALRVGLSRRRDITNEELEAIAEDFADLELEGAVSDHDASARAILEEEGIETDPAAKNVERGIERLYDLFAVDARGRARLVLYRDALVEPDPLLEERGWPLSLIDELPGYVYKKAPREGVAGREEPVKIKDDAIDALRMLVDTLGEADELNEPV